MRKKNSYLFRRMWRKTLEAIDKEPIEETPIMQKVRERDPEEYERVTAYMAWLKELAEEEERELKEKIKRAKTEKTTSILKRKD